MTTDRQQPRELLDSLMAQAQATGKIRWTCINWGPEAEIGPDTEVHLIVATPQAGLVVRLKSRTAVDDLIGALRTNGDRIWPPGP